MDEVGMGPNVLRLTEAQWQEMRSDAIRHAPEEACGLAAGRDGKVEALFAITNSLHSPVSFRMDPREQLRAFQQIEELGLELLAVYHSHPLGPAFPSHTDLEEFAYPGVAYIIWDGTNNTWDAAGFTLDNCIVVPIGLYIVDAA